jgi:DivIVA domain-containing protein
VEREEIERRDFPSARRGYDPAAVDDHLRRVADEVARQRPGSIAEGASTQVRAILQAAEDGAQQLRDDAAREAGDHVERVEDAAKAMLEKLERLQHELDRLLGGLKTTAETLTNSLAELSRDVGTLGGPESAPHAPPAAGPRSDDEAGARLVALNMALEGTPREETARFLAEHYELSDVDALLDDVYASAGR